MEEIVHLHVFAAVNTTASSNYYTNGQSTNDNAATTTATATSQTQISSEHDSLLRHNHSHEDHHLPQGNNYATYTHDTHGDVLHTCCTMKHYSSQSLSTNSNNSHQYAAEEEHQQHQQEYHQHEHHSEDDRRVFVPHRQHSNATAASQGSFLERIAAPKQSVLHEHHHHDQHIAQHLHGSLLASIVLLMALSIHSILEGLAVGSATREALMLSTTLAILAHKAFAGFALGSSMVASEMNPWHFKVLILIFALCTPLGVALGLLADALFLLVEEEEAEHQQKDGKGSGDGDDSADIMNIANAVIQCMVAGTFLYVGIVEVAMKELMSCRQSSHHEVTEKTRGDSVRLLAFLGGYVAMSVMAIFV